MEWKKPFLISVFIILIVAVIEYINALKTKKVLIGDENYFWIWLLIFLIFVLFNIKLAKSLFKKIKDATLWLKTGLVFLFLIILTILLSVISKEFFRGETPTPFQSLLNFSFYLFFPSIIGFWASVSFGIINFISHRKTEHYSLIKTIVLTIILATIFSLITLVLFLPFGRVG